MKDQSEGRLTLNGKTLTQPVDPEVRPKAQRRRWSAAEKLRVLEAAEACQAPGELGALLRREGIYSSTLSKWRRQREAGGVQGLTPQKRGRKAQVDPRETELARLRRENERLHQRLAQAETIIEVQKKLSLLLGIPLTSESDEQA